MEHVKIYRGYVKNLKYEMSGMCQNIINNIKYQTCIRYITDISKLKINCSKVFVKRYSLR